MIYYISTTGSDGNDGTLDKPFKTLKFTSTRTKPGDLIKMGAGVFVETPVTLNGVTLKGAGKGATIFRAFELFSSTSTGYAFSKFLLTLNSDTTVSDFSIDGSDANGNPKKLYGGIYVRGASNVTIDTIDIRNTFYTGAWLWSVKNFKIRNLTMLDCSWGSSAYSSGALNVADIDHFSIDANINEGMGYGIKAIGPAGANPISNGKITGNISVNPVGLWQNNKAPNICLELQAVKLLNVEISDMKVDCTISLVKEPNVKSTGEKTVHLKKVIFDMVTRAKGQSYPLELTLDDVEIEKCTFIRGRYSIANWLAQCKNWDIHNNVFYGLDGSNPGECVRSQKEGLANVKFYENDVFLDSGKTMNVIGVYGGASSNVVLKNNFLACSPMGKTPYPASVVHVENGTLTGLVEEDNVLVGFEDGVTGSYRNNLKIK